MNLNDTTPTEDLAAIGREWKQIESMIQRNLDRGTFPFQVICFDNDYTMIKSVSDSMGLHLRGLKNKNAKRKIIVCASSKDRRKPNNFRVQVGSATCEAIEELGQNSRSATLTEIPIYEGSKNKITMRTMFWTWTVPEPKPEPKL